MTLKLLETLPSGHPEFPLQAGQIIRLSRLTPEMHRWVKEGKAVVLHEEPALAVVEPTERAVTYAGKRRKP